MLTILTYTVEEKKIRKKKIAWSLPLTKRALEKRTEQFMLKNSSKKEETIYRFFWKHIVVLAVEMFAKFRIAL